MADAGLFQIGLPGADASLNSYTAIAQAEEAIASASGQLGLASAFAARQMAARFFIGGFGTADQQSQILPAIAAGDICVSIAISEPGAGAHPKMLQTTAVEASDYISISGVKGWVTNGPVADLYLILAVRAVTDGRKKFGLYVVPRDTPGLSIKPMSTLDGLAPASHCELHLQDCKLPLSARIGTMDDAYPPMAIAFRDYEDTVASGNTAGFVSWLLAKAAADLEHSDDVALTIGRFAALASLLKATSATAVAALDNRTAADPAHVIGIRLLAREIVDDIRRLLGDRTTQDPAIQRALKAYDLLSTVAREPRRIRQVRLGVETMNQSATP